MPNLISRDSSVIRNASHAMASFYDKQPVLAFITTVALPLVALIGLIFNIKSNQIKREDDQHAQACIDNLKRGNLRGAKKSASKIYSTEKRDKANASVSLAFLQQSELANASRMAERISNKDIKTDVFIKIKIRAI